MIEGSHLLNIDNLKNILKVLITSCFIFNIRLNKIKKFEELDFSEADSFDTDNLFEILGLLSYKIYENIIEKRKKKELIMII